MTREIMETPKTIVDGGKPRMGLFRRPFRTANLEDADVFRGPLGFMRWLRMREWIGFGITHPEGFFSLMIIDAKPLCIGVAYSFDRNTGEYNEWNRQGWGKNHCCLANTVWDDNSFFKVADFQLEYQHRLDAGRHEIRAEAVGRDGPGFFAELTFHQDMDRFPPLVANVPVKGNLFMYTHKTFLAVDGRIRVGDTEYMFDPGRDLANMDEHRAAYPLNAKWRWAAFGGYEPDGALIGFNAVDNANFAVPEKHNENVMWFGNRIEPFGPVTFEMDGREGLHPWHVRDKEGRVDLEFVPDGGIRKNSDFIVINIDYCQNFGRFRGTLIDESGQKHEVKDIYGPAERGDGFF